MRLIYIFILFNHLSFKQENNDSKNDAIKIGFFFQNQLIFLPNGKTIIV